jgi:hypothetical protein
MNWIRCGWAPSLSPSPISSPTRRPFMAALPSRSMAAFHGLSPWSNLESSMYAAIAQRRFVLVAATFGCQTSSYLKLEDRSDLVCKPRRCQPCSMAPGLLPASRQGCVRPTSRRPLAYRLSLWVSAKGRRQRAPAATGGRERNRRLEYFISFLCV